MIEQLITCFVSIGIVLAFLETAYESFWNEHWHDRDQYSHNGRGTSEFNDNRVVKPEKYYINFAKIKTNRYWYALIW